MRLPQNALSRRFKLGVAALALALASGLALTSTASSSQIQVTASSPPPVSSQSLQKFFRQRAGEMRAAICRSQKREFFACHGRPPSRPASVGRRRTLLRAYLNGNDPGCPYWNVWRPWPGYATMATQADVLCVTQVAGHWIDGSIFRGDQRPELAFLHLWVYHGHWIQWETSAYVENGCSAHPVNISVFVLHIEYAVTCSAHLFVHAPVFPPTGRYHGEVQVVTYRPLWTNAVMLDNANSEDYCFYC